MFNRVTLIGNLGRDPEIRRTNDGRPIANISIATSEHWRDKNTGEKREKTEWHRVVIFNEGLCGIVEKYLKKGSRCLVEGKLQTRKWQDQSGADRYSTEVVLNNFDARIVLLGDPKGGPQAEDYEGSRAYAEASGSRGGGDQPRQSLAEELDDEIPF